MVCFLISARSGIIFEFLLQVNAVLLLQNAFRDLAEREVEAGILEKRKSNVEDGETFSLSMSVIAVLHFSLTRYWTEQPT